jgi:hypothetical protein
LIQQKQVAEFAIWRTVAKLTRQHPGAFTTVGGNLDDRPAVILTKKTGGIHLSFGLHGVLEVTGEHGVSKLSSHESVEGPDFVAHIAHLEELAGLPTSEHLAHTTPESIGYLVIEELLRANLFRKSFFSVHPMVIRDTDGLSLVSERLPDELPKSKQKLGSQNTGLWYFNKTSLLRHVEEEPTQYVIDVLDGFLYSDAGRTDLQREYQSGGRDIEKMVAQLFERKRRSR